MSSSPSDFLKLCIVYILIKDIIFSGQIGAKYTYIYIYVSFFISDTICKMQVNKKTMRHLHIVSYFHSKN